MADMPRSRDEIDADLSNWFHSMMQGHRVERDTGQTVCDMEDRHWERADSAAAAIFQIFDSGDVTILHLMMEASRRAMLDRAEANKPRPIPEGSPF